MKVSTRQAGIVLAVVAVLAVYAAFQTQDMFRSDNYGDVTPSEASELIENTPGLVILDVRTQSEYDDGHIEGAILIPVQELPDRLDELDTDDELLVYCRTGNRSSTAVGILKDNGFTKIYHMNDGITGWISEDLPVV